MSGLVDGAEIFCSIGVLPVLTLNGYRR